MLFLIMLLAGLYSRAGTADSLQRIVNHYKKLNVNDSSLSFFYSALLDVYRNQEPYRGLLIATEGKQKAIVCGDRKGLAVLFNKEGNIYLDQGLHVSAITSYNQCLLINSRLGDRCAVAYAHNDIGYVYYLRRLYQSALAHFRQAVPLVRAHAAASSQEALAHTYNNMALTFEQLNQPDSAYRYLQRALLIRKRIGNRQGVAQSLAYLGRFSAMQKRHGAAEDYLNRAIHLDRETGSRIFEAYAWMYKGEHALWQKKYDVAVNHFSEAVKLLQDTSVARELIKVRLKRALAHYEAHKLSDAEEEAAACLQLARELRYYNEEQQAITQLINIAAKTGLRDEQIRYQQQLISCKMMAMQELDQQTIRQLESNQMVQNSRLTQLIQYKNEQIRLLEKRANLQARQFLIALLVFIVLLTIILLATINFRRKTEVAYKKLQKENDLLRQESDKYYSTIIQKLEQPISKHNELIMALSGKHSLFSESAVLQALRESEQVIKTAELPLLNVLYWARFKSETVPVDSAVSLRTAAEQTVQLMQTEFEQARCLLVNDVDASIRVKAPKGALQLIFRNLLDNALHHNESVDAVRVSAREKGKMIEIRVRDNGKGIPVALADAFDMSLTGHDVFEGMGLQVSKLICNKTGGDLWIESEEGKGTTVYFTLFNTAQ